MSNTRVWSASSTNPFLSERTARGRNVTPSAAAVLDTEVDGPRYGDGPIHHVTAGKHRVAKHPFSRLSAPAFDPMLATRNPA